MEKEEYDSPAVIALETYGERVVRDDWKLYIDEEVTSDLRKYRNYHGESVRDLLRALRNKVRDMNANEAYNYVIIRNVQYLC